MCVSCRVYFVDFVDIDQQQPVDPKNIRQVSVVSIGEWSSGTGFQNIQAALNLLLLQQGELAGTKVVVNSLRNVAALIFVSVAGSW